VKQPTIVALGRFGDIANALPAAYSLARKGARPRFVVSKDFSSILDGVSYVDRVEFDGDYKNLNEAIRIQRSQGFEPIVFQAYKHPDKQRLTNSYAKEGWRIAGFLPFFGAIPLVFDQREEAHERELVAQHIKPGSPVILLALSGVSSPFPLDQELRNLITARCPDCQVVDLAKIKARRPYDLLGLIDAADLLVSIDTLHLHLARASRTPTVAIVNDGWLGSSPPPQSVVSFRYAQARANLFAVGEAVESILEQGKRESHLVHVVHMHGKTDRHQRAQQGWPASWTDNTITNLGTSWDRSALALGDSRRLPYLRDILSSALEMVRSDHDCIVWMNDDVALPVGALERLRKHVLLWDAVSIRRQESNATEVHMGRELFAFRAGWLRRHLEKIPDYLIGTEAFDLGLSAYIRRERGIESTFRNFSTDFFPCELPPGLALHEPHESSWASMIASPANVYNRKLFRNWAAQFQKTLRFNDKDQLCP
jgi:hypothetical protein